MNLLLATFGDPVWQIGGGIILLATLVLLLAVRSPEIQLSLWHPLDSHHAAGLLLAFPRAQCRSGLVPTRSDAT